MKGLLTGIAAACCLAVASPAAQAQDHYPNDALNWIIPFPAGGGTDKLVRRLQESSGRFFGEPWSVENRPGAGGTVGWQHMLNQEADGYTVLVGSVTPVITVLQEDNPPFTPDQVRVVAYYSLADLALITRDDRGWDDWDAFMAHVRENPGTVTGGGSNAALLPLAYVFDQLALDVVLIPYPGGGPAMTDVIGGHIDGVTIGTNTLEDLGDTLMGVATFGNTNLPEDVRARVGDIPWVGDYGAQGMSVPRFVGVHPDTPEEVVAALSDLLGTMLTDELLVADVLSTGESLTYYPTERAGAEYADFVDATRRFLPLLTQN